MATQAKLFTQERCTSKQAATASIIWLHGLGADSSDFMGIVSELPLPEEISWRFIFPNAPMRNITLNQGMTMRAWYDFADMNIGQNEDQAGIQASSKLITALIQQEQQRGIATDKIVLAGFSQGGAMALYTGLTYPQKLAGIMALSSYLPLASVTLSQSQHKDLPIFMAHGLYDPIIPYAFALQSRQKLSEINGLEWFEYPMEHGVHPKEINDISIWLLSILKSSS